MGALLRRHFAKTGDSVTVLSRKSSTDSVVWDGQSLGDWVNHLDGADVLINLAGRTVNCRYSTENMNEIMQSRVRSVRVLGEALAKVNQPPKVWLQASTATIYAHRLDAPNDELTGILGGDEPGAPATWNSSIAVAKAWENELEQWDIPGVRRVALRSAMTMSRDKGSVFDVFATLARRGLGGRLGSGRQYVSWIHEADFAASIDFLIRSDLAGPVNICSPNPVPQVEFARALRDAVGIPFGLPATEWMIEIGTWAMRTESELVLKSRRVVPTRLLQAGFTFKFPEWGAAAKDLITNPG